ncbi:MAG: BrnA antitoxin family protein [Acidiferrobacteraceae bacterium]
MKPHYDFSQGKRGAVVPSAPTKTRITIRLDGDIIAWFRHQTNEAGGGNYQSLINDALRKHIEHGAVPFEDTLRRVIREELQKTG